MTQKDLEKLVQGLGEMGYEVLKIDAGESPGRNYSHGHSKAIELIIVPDKKGGRRA